MTDQETVTASDGATSGPPAPRISWRGYLLVFAVALLVRGVTYLELSGADPYFGIPIVDEQHNHQQALRIAHGDLKPREPYWKPPLYSHVLAVVYRPGLSETAQLFEDAPPLMRRAKIAQVLLDSGSAVLVTRLGMLVLSPLVGITAGLIYAVAFTPVYFSLQLLDTTLFVFLCLAMLLAVISARHDGRPSSWFLAGCLIGLAATARAPALLFVPVAGLVPFLRAPDGTSPARPLALLSAALLAFGTLMPVLPVTLMNWKFAGDTVLISANGGYNFYVGNRTGDDIGADGLTPVRPGPRDWEVMALGGDSPRASERSSEMYAATWREIGEQPGHFIRRLVRKTHALFHGYEIPNNKNFDEERQRSWMFRLLPGRTGLITAIGLVGLFFLGRSLRERWIWVGFLLTQAAGIVLFFVAARYRVPLTAVLCVPAAAWILSVVTGSPTLTRRTAAIVVAIVAILLVSIDPTGRADRYASYVIDPLALGHAEEIRASRFAREGNSKEALASLAAAERYYERALELDPDHPQAHNNLGILDLRNGRLEAAAARFRQAVECVEMIRERVPDFDLPEAWNNLGETLLYQANDDLEARLLDAAQAKFEEARSCFTRAVKADPLYATPHANLGKLLEGAQQFQEAKDHYLEALRLDPSRAVFALLVARACVKLNQVPEAQARLRRVASEHPQLGPDEEALRKSIVTQIERL